MASQNRERQVDTQSSSYVVAYNSPLTTYQTLKNASYRTQIKNLILSTFGTQKAIDVAFCESGLNPRAINDNPKTGDYSVGLFQINLYGKLREKRPSEAWLLIPENNIKYAYQMYLKSGWSAWSCADIVSSQ